MTDRRGDASDPSLDELMNRLDALAADELDLRREADALEDAPGLDRVDSMLEAIAQQLPHTAPGDGPVQPSAQPPAQRPLQPSAQPSEPSPSGTPSSHVGPAWLPLLLAAAAGLLLILWLTDDDGRSDRLDAPGPLGNLLGQDPPVLLAPRGDTLGLADLSLVRWEFPAARSGWTFTARIIVHDAAADGEILAQSEELLGTRWLWTPPDSETVDGWPDSLVLEVQAYADGAAQGEPLRHPFTLSR